MRKHAEFVVLLTFGILGGNPGLRAQEIVEEAMQCFPEHTVRLEYSNPEKLRQLSNYNALRQHYLGAQLQQIEKSLARLGVHEEDIGELALGWEVGAKDKGSGGLVLFGLAAGHFRITEIEARATDEGLGGTQALDADVYCMDHGMCFAFLDDTRAALGSLQQLSNMGAARAGDSPSLSSNEEFANLVAAVKPGAPIWGVAKHAAMAHWLSTSMPGQEGMHFNWSDLFTGVNSLSYTIEVGDKVNLAIRAGCASETDAVKMWAGLNALRILQGLAWGIRNPSHSNPLEHLDVDRDSDRVELKIEAPLSTL
jgi:hypothetical protein